ncbi:type II secretion system protein M [Haloferax larsenii]|uniref:Type II secretion system protein M n=1 Tax=Haloferax larsenii TaxID=302484 RepID=A0ABY5RHB7_HALLR|nr:type II secretion system protein M [Haloferax larsenii]UVE51430.1 type II secretion system protein M [Haloferax larsenii]
MSSIVEGGLRDRLTDREKTLIILSAAVMFVFGVWVGIWIIPSAALDVPMNSHYDGRQVVDTPAYQPVPTYLPIGSLTIVLLALYAAKHFYFRESPPELAATDGGDDRGEESESA